MKKVLVALHDPGGAKALLPVIQELQHKASLTLYISEFAQNLYSNFAFSHLPSQLSDQEAIALITKCNPDLILTGTSWGSNAEQALRNFASVKKIPSYVMLDYWANYGLRWKGSDYPLSQSPDIIFTIDQNMKSEMVAEGFVPQQLLVAGHPYLENMSLHPKAAQQNLLFLSDPFTAANLKGLHPVLAVAQAMAKAGIKNATITIKPHPKEIFDPALLLKLQRHASMPVQLVAANEPLPALLHSHCWVVGYQSIALFEAKANGNTTIALDTGAVAKQESLMAALSNFSIPVVPASSDSIYEYLKNFADMSPHNETSKFYSGATQFILQNLLGH